MVWQRVGVCLCVCLCWPTLNALISVRVKHELGANKVLAAFSINANASKSSEKFTKNTRE